MTQQNKNTTSLSKDYSTTVTILEHLSDALFILNPQGNIEYANSVACDLLGLPLSQILGEAFNKFLKAEFDPGLMKNNDYSNPLLENIYRGSYNEMETSLINGEYVTPVMISFGLVKDSKQEITFIIASAKDITIRKELEKELQQQQLMALSRDRYKELGELAVNMVHNLSQPITSVRLMLELMAKQIDTDRIDKTKATKNIQEIIGVLDSMTTSITNVRNFAFLTGDESLKPVLVDEIVSDVLKQLDYELTENNIKINVESKKDQYPVVANPISLQQVLMTLLRFFWSDSNKNNQLRSTSHSPKQTLTVSIQNSKDRWVHVAIHNGSDSPSNTAMDSTEMEKPLIGSNLDFTVIQIILTSIGGDFQINKGQNNALEFVMRIPINKGAERDQLRNMIEMFHT